MSKVRGYPDLEALTARGLVLGRDVYIGQGTMIDPWHCWLISIGDEAVLSARVVVLAHDGTTRRELGYTRIARVSIGRRAFIGASAHVLLGVTIGDDAIVGAGSVVRRDVPPGALAVSGGPQRNHEGWVARRRPGTAQAAAAAAAEAAGDETLQS